MGSGHEGTEQEQEEKQDSQSLALSPLGPHLVQKRRLQRVASRPVLEDCLGFPAERLSRPLRRVGNQRRPGRLLPTQHLRRPRRRGHWLDPRRGPLPDHLLRAQVRHRARRKPGHLLSSKLGTGPGLNFRGAFEFLERRFMFFSLIHNIMEIEAEMQNQLEEYCAAGATITPNKEGTHWVRIEQSKEEKIVFKQVESAVDSIWAVDKDNQVYFKEYFMEDLNYHFHTTVFGDEDGFEMYNFPGSALCATARLLLNLPSLSGMTALVLIGLSVSPTLIK